MIWICPNCWTEYEIDEKFSEVLKQKKDCKFCVRKRPDIPTTAEMDGLLTVEDMRSRFTFVVQCMSCRKWTVHKDREYLPCSNCGEVDYDLSSLKSIRCYNPDVDNKRKPNRRNERRTNTR